MLRFGWLVGGDVLSFVLTFFVFLLFDFEVSFVEYVIGFMLSLVFILVSLVMIYYLTYLFIFSKEIIWKWV